jgi:hypothetical protein
MDFGAHARGKEVLHDGGIGAKIDQHPAADDSFDDREATQQAHEHLDSGNGRLSQSPSHPGDCGNPEIR